MCGVVRETLDSAIGSSVAEELELAAKLAGIGESVEDLRPFDADDFFRALLGAAGL